MMCKAKVAVCSDIRTKHSTQSERRVEFLNVKTWRYVKKPLGVKRLIKVKSCNVLLRVLLVGIRSHMKSVLRYKFLILGPYHPDILYSCQQGC